MDQWRKDIEALYEAVKTGGDYWREHAKQQQLEAEAEAEGGGQEGSKGPSLVVVV